MFNAIEGNGGGHLAKMLLLTALVCPARADETQVAPDFVQPIGFTSSDEGEGEGEGKSQKQSPQTSSESAARPEIPLDPNTFPDVLSSSEKFGILGNGESPRDYLIKHADSYLNSDKVETLLSWTRSMDSELDPSLLSWLRKRCTKDIGLPITLTRLLSAEESELVQEEIKEPQERVLVTLKMAFSADSRDQQRLEIVLRLMPEDTRRKLLGEIFEITKTQVATPKALLKISSHNESAKLELLHWLARKGFYFQHAITEELAPKLDDPVYRRLMVDQSIVKLTDLIDSLGQSSSVGELNYSSVKTKEFGVISPTLVRSKIDREAYVANHLVVPLINSADAKAEWPTITGITTALALLLQDLEDSNTPIAVELCHLDTKIRLRDALQGFVRGAVSRDALLEELLHLRPAVKLAGDSIAAPEQVDDIIRIIACGSFEQAINDLLAGKETLSLLEAILSENEPDGRLRCAILANSPAELVNLVYQANRPRGRDKLHSVDNSGDNLPKSPAEALGDVVAGTRNSALWLRLPEQIASYLEGDYPDVLAAQNITSDDIIRYATLLTRIPKGALKDTRIKKDLELLVRIIMRSVDSQDNELTLTQSQARELTRQLHRALQRAWDHRVIQVRDFPDTLRDALVGLVTRERSNRWLDYEDVGFIAAFAATGCAPREVGRIFSQVDRLDLSHLAFYIQMWEPANKYHAGDYVGTFGELLGKIPHDLDLFQPSVNSEITKITRFLIKCYREPTATGTTAEQQHIRSANSQVGMLLVQFINAISTSACEISEGLERFEPGEMQRAAEAIIQLPVLPVSQNPNEYPKRERTHHALQAVLSKAADSSWYREIGNQLPIDKKLEWIRAGVACSDKGSQKEALSMLLEALESADPQQSSRGKAVLDMPFFLGKHDYGQQPEALLPHLLNLILTRLRANQRPPAGAIHNLQQVVGLLSEEKYTPTPEVAQQIEEILQLSANAGPKGILQTMLKRLRD